MLVKPLYDSMVKHDLILAESLSGIVDDLEEGCRQRGEGSFEDALEDGMRQMLDAETGIPANTYFHQERMDLRRCLIIAKISHINYWESFP